MLSVVCGQAINRSFSSRMDPLQLLAVPVQTSITHELGASNVKRSLLAGMKPMQLPIAYRAANSAAVCFTSTPGSNILVVTPKKGASSIGSVIDERIFFRKIRTDDETTLLMNAVFIPRLDVIIFNSTGTSVHVLPVDTTAKTSEILRLEQLLAAPRNLDYNLAVSPSGIIAITSEEHENQLHVGKNRMWHIDMHSAFKPVFSMNEEWVICTIPRTFIAEFLPICHVPTGKTAMIDFRDGISAFMVGNPPIIGISKWPIGGPSPLLRVWMENGEIKMERFGSIPLGEYGVFESSPHSPHILIKMDRFRYELMNVSTLEQYRLLYHEISGACFAADGTMFATHTICNHGSYATIYSMKAVELYRVNDDIFRCGSLQMKFMDGSLVAASDDNVVVSRIPPHRWNLLLALTYYFATFGIWPARQTVQYIMDGTFIN
jgi:hypothetical protein